MLFGFSAPKIGGVLMKTFSKGSFTHFFQKMALWGGVLPDFTRFGTNYLHGDRPMGTDFFVEHSQIPSLTRQARYVLHVDHGNGRESVPLEQSEHTSSYLRVCKKERPAMMVAPKN